MAPNDTFAQPAFGKLIVSLAIGIAVGVAFAAPVIRDDMAGLALGDIGPVGNVLLIGVLSVAVVTTGLVGLYRLFWLVDR